MPIAMDAPIQEIDRERVPSSSIDPWRLVLFPARVFLALGWIRAAVEKIIDPAWWSGDYLLRFLSDQETTMLSFLPPLVGHVGERTAALLSLIVLVSELTIGACLLTARSLRPALWVACVLNASFVALGAVSPSAFYLVIQLTLLLGLSAGRSSAARPKLVTIAMSWIAALSMLPFVRTLHPHEVIEDPALMLATVAGLAAATSTIRRIDQTVLDLPRLEQAPTPSPRA